MRLPERHEDFLNGHKHQFHEANEPDRQIYLDEVGCQGDKADDWSGQVYH